MDAQNNLYSYRKAKLNDIDEVMLVIEDGREVLKHQNGGQWQNGYPSKDDLLLDIKNEDLYVIIHKDLIVGVLALIEGDIEYPFLETGKWLSDLPFLVMHRCAIKKEYQRNGLGYFLFQIFEEVALKKGIHSLRIDTHKNNYIMTHILDKCGFIKCGTIILKPNKHRLVYEKIVK